MFSCSPFQSQCLYGSGQASQGDRFVVFSWRAPKGTDDDHRKGSGPASVGIRPGRRDRPLKGGLTATCGSVRSGQSTAFPGPTACYFSAINKRSSEQSGGRPAARGRFPGVERKIYPHFEHFGFCEGFRMTALRGRCGKHRGRRSKASREGTRGRLGRAAVPRYGDLMVVE